MKYLIRTVDEKHKTFSLPELVEDTNLQKYLRTYVDWFKGVRRLDIVKEPQHNEKVMELLKNEKLHPDTDAVVDKVTSGFDGSCTCPGSPTIYTYPNGDPGDPGSDPEFDNLPDAYGYKEEISTEWANQLLINGGIEEGIYSMSINNEDREAIIKFSMEEAGKDTEWLTDEEIIERFADMGDLYDDYY